MRMGAKESRGGGECITFLLLSSNTLTKSNLTKAKFIQLTDPDESIWHGGLAAADWFRQLSDHIFNLNINQKERKQT